MFPEPQNADESPAVQASQNPTPEFSDVCVIARRKSLFDLVVSWLFAGVLLTAFMKGMASPVLYVFLPIVLISLWANLALFARPPRAIVRDKQFSLQLMARWDTPAANVAQLELRSGQMTVTFHDVQCIEPKSQQSVLSSQFSRHGYHVKTARDMFSLEDVNRVRAALGMPQQEQDQLAEFESRLNELTTRVFITPALISVCVIVFLIMVLSGEGIVQTNVLSLIRWGANYGPLTSNGQWWRLLTSMFLHIGAIHLLFNMWILKDIGRVVERLVGNAGFVIGYLLSGFSGSVAGVMWHESVVSAGASGAIFGVFGMLLGFLLLNRRSIPDEVLKIHRGNALAFLAYNVLVGLSIPWVDQAAHLGGFVAGFCCGLVLSCDLTYAALQRRFRNGVLAVSGVLIGIVVVIGLPVSGPDLLSIGTRIDEVDTAVAATAGDAFRLLESGEQEPRVLVAKIRKEFIPKYAELSARIEETSAHNVMQSRTKALYAEYVQLRQQGWELTAESIENNDLVREGLAIEKFEAAREVMAKAIPDFKDSPMPADLKVEVAVFAACESRAFTRYEELSQQSARGEITDQELANGIEREVLSVWQDGQSRFVTHTRSLPSQDQPVVAGITKYFALQREGWQLQVEGLREQDAARTAKSQEKFAEAVQTATAIWQASEGQGGK